MVQIFWLRMSGHEQARLDDRMVARCRLDPQNSLHGGELCRRIAAAAKAGPCRIPPYRLTETSTYRRLGWIAGWWRTGGTGPARSPPRCQGVVVWTSEQAGWAKPSTEASSGRGVRGDNMAFEGGQPIGHKSTEVEV